MVMTRFVRMVMTRFVRCNSHTRFDRSIRLDGFSFIGVTRSDFSGIDGINRFNRLDRCSRVFFVARSVDGIIGVKGLRHTRWVLDRSRLAACSKVLV